VELVPLIPFSLRIALSQAYHTTDFVVTKSLTLPIVRVHRMCKRRSAVAHLLTSWWS
jgi:hypothetical protein